MEFTEKWLGEIGGWQAMKAARGLVDAGLVELQTAEATLVRGLAGSGKMKFSCGLRIKTRSDVDNLCTCPAARRGMICEHSIAVALMHISPASRSATPSRTRDDPRKPSQAPAPAPVVAPSPASRRPLRVPGRYTLFLPDTLFQGIVREPIGAYAKFEPGGDAEESLLAAWLAEQGVKGQSVPMSLNAKALAELLPLLAGHPRIIAGKPSGGGTPVGVASDPVRMALLVEAEGDQVKLSLEGSSQGPLFKNQPAGWWTCRDTGSLFPLPPIQGEVATILAGLPARRPLPWLVAQRDALADVFQVETRGAALERFHVAPVPCTFILNLDGSFQAADVTLSAEYQSLRWNITSKGTSAATEKLFPIQDPAAPGTFYVSNRHGESRLLARLQYLGFKSAGLKLGTADTEVFRLSGQDNVMRFYASELPRLRHELRIVEGEKWRAATRSVGRIQPQVRQIPADGSGSAGSDWLAMEFGYESPDGFRLPRAEVLRLVRSGQRSVQGKNGKRYLLDLQEVEEFEDTLKDVPLQITPDGARISALHADYFLPGSEASAPLPEEKDTLSLLGDLGARLRPYQLLGVRWMTSLAHAGRGGLLGDEMGLGKTVQSIALVASLLLKREKQVKHEPVLIVCPKSLCGNWLSEFQRFAHHLKVTISQGNKRDEVLNQLHVFDVIITTYQLIVRDSEVIKKQMWSLILLDEASYIRNPDTDAAKALRGLRAHSRIALTGTPVENSTRDLWSIYQFLLPGYLGSRENFKERFDQPIQTALGTPAGQAASERLKKLIRPYFLRRTKREVLRDLPDKIEQVLWCDPSPAQGEVYRRLLEEGREEIKAARKRSGQGGAKMTMFTVLLRLRQACCDLRLTGLQNDTIGKLDRDDLSGKWPMLKQRLESIIDGGGKVLIFSQFVQYLRLVRDYLGEEKIPYAYLDGSSQDRDAQVKTFQTDPACRVFLISLKAGGYGLNLTAADHVILMDPWWNPAVESQAIDRAHRIGQQRVVTAYRLALRGTVEERILALQAKKRGLVEAAIDDQSPLMAGLLESDLEDLIAG
ncbi:helicase-like protein [Prosthecobacter fusiformis]|uniref:Helicase-like protein n=1 Tax=Prosthecobacter fusiformis TaxID=48464 RepID=A0A4R7S464_9BACT|nr:DEAD/DEAH box helicase [Prosthecobacter fusiformis]TDU73200.1 helicase-like protein [Prosthecobacter fusiformis]